MTARYWYEQDGRIVTMEWRPMEDRPLRDDEEPPVEEPDETPGPILEPEEQPVTDEVAE